MAEFTKVWAEMKRMCETYPSCKGCPLESKRENRVCDETVPSMITSIESPVEFEKRIMAWVAAHPQKTLLDAFYEKFPNAERLSNGTLRICPYHLDPKWGGLCDDGTSGNCRECWAREVDG